MTSRSLNNSRNPLSLNEWLLGCQPSADPLHGSPGCLPRQGHLQPLAARHLVCPHLPPRDLPPGAMTLKDPITKAHIYIHMHFYLNIYTYICVYACAADRGSCCKAPGMCVNWMCPGPALARYTHTFIYVQCPWGYGGLELWGNGSYGGYGGSNKSASPQIEKGGESVRYKRTGANNQ